MYLNGKIYVKKEIDTTIYFITRFKDLCLSDLSSNSNDLIKPILIPNSKWKILPRQAAKLAIHWSCFIVLLQALYLHLFEISSVKANCEIRSEFSTSYIDRTLSYIRFQDAFNEKKRKTKNKAETSVFDTKRSLYCRRFYCKNSLWEYNLKNDVVAYYTNNFTKKNNTLCV